MSNVDLSIILSNGTMVSKIKWNGNTIIEGRPGSEFSIKLKNNSYERKLAIVSIDGLSILDGKPAGSNSSGYVLNGYEEITIPGWMIDSKTAAKFQFRNTGNKKHKSKTYVEQLENLGYDVDVENQGIIGLMVYDEKKYYYGSDQWIQTYNPNVGYRNHRNKIINGDFSLWERNTISYKPDNFGTNEDFVFASASVNSTLNNMGTGFGQDTNFDTVSTTFERSGAAIITTIEYDDYKGWIAKGVPHNLLRPTTNKKKAFPAGVGCVRP